MSDIADKDLKFKCTQLRNGSRFKAMRAAVLTPILNNVEWLKSLPESAYAGLSTVRQAWKRRLYDLQEANWFPVAKPDPDVSKYQMSYLRNCPPFGVLTQLHARPCKRRAICPFCYARSYVGEPYVLLEKFLFGEKHVGPDGKWVKAKKGCNLLEFRYTVRTRTPDDKLLTPQAVEDMIAVGKQWMSKHRRDEIDLLKPDCAAVLYRLEIEAGRFIDIQRSVLLVTRKAINPKALRPPKSDSTKSFYTCDIHEEPDKTTLWKAASRCFRYPVSLLRAPPRLVVSLLHGLKHFHLLSTYGG